MVSVAPDESLELSESASPNHHHHHHRPSPRLVADPRGAVPKPSAVATMPLHHRPSPHPVADPRGAVPKPSAVATLPLHHRPSPPASTPARSRTSSISSISSTASSWSTLALNEAEQHRRWAAEFAFCDALKFPPPPNPDVYHRMTEEEAEAEVEKWVVRCPIPPLPLFFERAVSKAGFKIRSQAINDVYRGWLVSTNLVGNRSARVCV